MGYALSSMKVETIDNKFELSENSIHACESEFRKTFRRISPIVESLERMPCQNKAKDIINCLQDHRHEIIQCFSLMETYKNCIKKAVSEKVERFAYEIEPIPQTKWECL